MDLITMRGLSKDFIEKVLAKAAQMEPIAREKRNVDVLKGKTLASLFFEPSTRTQISFHTAMARLGGTNIGFADPKTTSGMKGETLADTIRVVEGYANCIVMRHPMEGSAARAAEVAEIPIINAGDGSNQHPTQALLDLYTIKKEKKKIDGLTVLMAGDLKYGRTVHSLLYALSNYDVKVELYSPPSLKMPSWMVDDVGKKIEVREVDGITADADVVYATRVQKERFPDEEEYKKNVYVIDDEMLGKMKEDAIIMHPLPRVNEISPQVDADKRAKYFDQSFYGVPVRMALLEMLMAD